MDLTLKLRQAYANRIAHAGFDLRAALDEVLGAAALHVDDAGGTVTHVGADPVIASPMRIGGAATIALLGKSIAAAALHRWRGGPGQDISVDLRPTPHRLCPFYDGKWELLGRFPAVPTVETGNVLGATLFRTRDNRWVLPQAMYPGLRLRAQKLLGVPLTYEPVAEAIGQWDALALEQAGEEAGLVLPMVRSLPEFLAEDQYQDVLAEMPLIEISRIGDAPCEPLLPLGEQPFSGYRALGMGHVIAGAGLGRSLALHGADVLNLWKLGEAELEPIYASANVGLRSSWIVPRHDRARIVDLLRDADIFFHNRRPAFLREAGLTPEDVARERPGIIYVSVSLHGLTGPWVQRPGFDQSAGAVTGFLALQGSDEAPELPPIGVVNDYLTAWLAQIGIVAALRRRAEEGGSYHVHVSLTRVALWILSLGIFDREWALRTAGSSPEHEYRDPETFRAQTPMGIYQGVTDQVSMSLTPGRYDPVLVPRGSSDLQWL
ncbi:crotonobetainyl-CoA:carnitine CoA-transferase CaiB-like acyl-CoA transferase [Novosphingobium chloroacetimidivorans]|uniref:Crotonobetainyl-CoA:carnitine CoA-transferase CaiB-like acyl-CoA transferase n=1 Tax=Novosphingobium chloroacetimidivorans TaxID=1428314 RepID=A0A7W7NVU3_9SPHN|nr:CoA transferase [Novosphingobium chloroacetimidivorans]MBB4858863.1 crotonobetainyl-CoA:carnitine CoA-transferase CaiB-like acyl-CoA transferase [Novosphingobium chloroacetimidivorans]